MGYTGTKEERYEKNRAAQLRYLSDPEKRAAHIRRCAERNTRLRAEQNEYLNVLKAAPCLDCHNTFPVECMDFDHVRGEKVKDVARIVGSSWKRLLAEVEKCEVVCANCHRIRTKLRRDLTTTSQRVKALL